MFHARRAALIGLMFAIASRAHADSLLVVCPRPWQASLADWVELRTEQGHTLRVISPGETTPDFGGAAYGLLVVGDGGAAGLPPGQVASQIVSRYGPEHSIASDAPHAESFHAHSVARLPFATEATLRAYLDRVVSRESGGSPSATERVIVGAGVAGFSPLIDAAIEGAARQLFRDLAPTDAEVSLKRFPMARQSLSASTSRGGVWVWLGHGLRDRLPGVPRESLVDATEGADVAVLVACYAGDFAAPGWCVAEQLLNHPEGPVAVVAATRVSMPYGNARLGGELLAALRRTPNRGVGELLAVAKQASLQAADKRLEGLDAVAQLLGAREEDLPTERREHAAMYHLLGDPLIRVCSDQSQPRVATASGDGQRR